MTLGLCREVIYWALAARRADGGAAPSDLRALWDASQPQMSAASPPDNEASAALRRTLFDDYAPHSLAVTDADAARAREFAEALVWDLDAPRRRIERVLIQRWLRVALLGAVLFLLVIGGRVLMLGPNLAAGKPFRLSSSFSGWAACVANNGCNGLMFHTETEPNPWVEIDLGAPKKVASRRGDQPGRLLRRPRDAAGGGGEHRSRRVDAGGPPQRTVWQLDGELPGARRPLRAADRAQTDGAAPAGDRDPVSADRTEQTPHPNPLPAARGEGT